MTGTKTITDLITDKETIKAGRINIIDAPVSSGKTHFALNVLPAWAGSPSKILYLIDTTNGEMRMQRNILTVGRQTYALYDYGKKTTWGERSEEAENNMPVMTYAGFGAEVRFNSSAFPWHNFEYIVCDEMQNLVNYQKYKNGTVNIEAAEAALRSVAVAGKTKIIAMSATPQPIRERFGELCYDVPFDRSNLRRLETHNEIPFYEEIEYILWRHKGQTGILYVSEIQEMEKYIKWAKKHGIYANGFWSVNATTPMTQEQLQLRRIVLEQETIPEEIDLLVINAASQTCIKIQGEKRDVDFIIVNNKNDEVKTQVRGRYHGDLQYFYYHDIEAANDYAAKHNELPEDVLNVRLYSYNWPYVCEIVGARRPHGGFYSMPTVAKYLQKNGYTVVKKKDSKLGGRYYYVISRDTDSQKTDDKCSK